MSKATKPTLLQNLQITAAGLTPKDWLVVSDKDGVLKLSRRGDGRIRTIKRAQ